MEDSIEMAVCFLTPDLIAHFNTRRLAGRKTRASVHCL